MLVLLWIVEEACGMLMHEYDLLSQVSRFFFFRFTVYTSRTLSSAATNW